MIRSYIKVNRSRDTLTVDESELELGTATLEILAVPQQGLAGAPGADGMTGISEDASPALGGDLDLNGFSINGVIEDPNFVIDGGLL